MRFSTTSGHVIALLFLTLPPAARAQVVADGATNTLNSVTNSVTGNVVVGTNGSFTRLVLTNGTLLTNTSSGFIGLNASARSNYVILDGANTRWLNALSLTIGSSGSFNWLQIGNGALMRNTIATIGSAAGASNNQVSVTGTGSLWTNTSTLTLGGSGSFNTLTVSNGGRVASLNATIGQQASAIGNQAVITGTGSGWASSGFLTVGSQGSFNGLLISNGGWVANTDGTLGFSSGSVSNVATVTGPGSRWTNRGDLTIGRGGSGNQLFISNGGGVVVSNDAYLGFSATGGGNTAEITGAGSAWLVGSNLYVGRSNANNAVAIREGAVVDNQNSYIGWASFVATNNSVLVTGAGSRWSNRGGLFVGFSSPDNRLEVRDGAVVRSATGTLGVTGAARRNEVLLTGTGSTWSISSNLRVGGASGLNRLVVSNGAGVIAAGAVIGDIISATNNEAVITGVGSSLTVGSNLTVGLEGMANRLIVSNGGRVAVDGYAYLGDMVTSSNNSALITGVGSLWTNTALNVGFRSSFNRLIVSNGGSVSTYLTGYIGVDPSSSHNEAWITGAGSKWESPGGLVVGNSGYSNLLMVSNGGMIRSPTGTIGNSSFSSNNTMVVTGVGSVASHTGFLYVGDSGDGNRLVVSEGGMVDSATASLGTEGSSSNNSALITGAGSLWTNINMNVGFRGSFNRLTVSNGGVVMSQNATIGHFSNYNEALITGVGSLWENNLSVIVVGNLGSGNRLIVSNGGTMRSSGGRIGDAITASNNSAWVTGTGSVWTNSSTLRVGDNGSGNRLLVSDGGTVRSLFGFVGNSLPSSNNVAIVTGADSRWQVDSSLELGDDGSFNTLLITNAGTVAASALTVGDQVSAISNTLDIFGGNLLITNPAMNGGLRVGRNGQGTLNFNGGIIVADELFVTNNGPGYTNSVFNFNHGTLTTLNGSVITQSTDFVIGNTSGQTATWLISGGTNTVALGVSNITSLGGVTGSTGVVTVTGGGTLWSHDGNLYVGRSNAGSMLLITNGARVANNFGRVGGTTNAGSNQVIVTGINSVWTNDINLIVGYAGSFNTLLIADSGRVANTSGRIGFASTARSNQVTVTGPGSLWTNSGDLYVGSSGSGNRLVVSNGATVGNTFGYLGFNAGSSNNVAVVTGTNSRWINSSNFYIGSNTTGNALLISDGGTVVSQGGGFVGHGVLADNNLAIISGPGSLWNTLTLSLGDFGSGNQVVITNGGTVRSSTGRIGQSSLSSANVVTVTGAESLWANSGIIRIGSAGSENHLVVSNGGTVQAGFVVLGENSGFSTNNRVTVDGGALMITNFGGLRGLDIRRGTNVFNSGLIVTDRLLVTNGALSQFEFNGGTLVVRGGTNNTGQAFVVGAAGSTAAILDVRSNTPLTLNNGFTLGANTAPMGNRLLLTNGGTLSVVSGNSTLGNTPGSSNNLALINGAGSLWTSSSSLRVGGNGSGNQLVVSNGGTVSSFGGSLGLNPGSINNVAVVTGAGSVWTSSADLTVGSGGSSNRLVVSNGGSVVAGTDGHLGFSTGANNNVAVVTGAGSLWTVGTLRVGGAGSSNQLVISNGGTVMVTTGFGTIGSLSSASGNSVLVTGAASLWTNNGSLFVGQSGSGSQLVVSNGGTVTATNVSVGLIASSLNNRVIVDGGHLFVTHATGTAALDVRRGTNVLNAGNIVTDSLLLTNSAGLFEFNGGTLDARSATVSNGLPFIVGNGTSGASYDMSGTATNVHSFANALVIASNATLTGTGTIIGTVTNLGTISLGNSPGAITINGDLRLLPSSRLGFEIGGLIATNEYDVLTVTNFLQFAGTLSLTLLDNFLPASGDTFTLFHYGSASGGFDNVVLNRVSLTNNLASFAVNYSLTNLVLGDVTYTDTDGDGQPDLFEQAAGTDALVSDSVLRVTSLAPDPSGNIVVTFQSVPGKNYRIEYSGNLTNWSTATTNVPSAGTTTTWTDDGSQTGGLNFFTTQRFYRVGLQ